MARRRALETEKKTANTKALKGAEFNMGLREGEEG